MHQAGIEVRPLPDIDGPGTLLNEVFLPDAGVAGVAVVGEVNDGWRATLTTLANERNLLGANTQGVGGKLEIHGHDPTTPISELLARAASDADAPSAKVRGYHLLAEPAHQRAVDGNAVVRQALARPYSDHDTA